MSYKIIHDSMPVPVPRLSFGKKRPVETSTDRKKKETKKGLEWYNDLPTKDFSKQFVNSE